MCYNSCIAMPPSYQSAKNKPNKHYMKDHQTQTPEAAAHFERLHGERPDELSRYDFDNEPDFDFEDCCPRCHNQGNYDMCTRCENGCNYEEGEE